MAGKSESIVIEIVADDNGKQGVTCQYNPATAEAGPGEHQAALELAIHALIQKAIVMRLAQGQRVPAALAVTFEAKTFLDFFPDQPF